MINRGLRAPYADSSDFQTYITEVSWFNEPR